MPHRHPARRHRAALPLSAAALVLGLTSCSAVQDVREPSEFQPVVGGGGRVAGLSGSYTFRDDDLQEREQFSLRATIDEYLTDHHVVGAYALGQFSNIESDPDGREQVWAGVHYHYHHHLSERTALFAGPQIGLTFFDDSFGGDSSLTYGLSGGLRHWLTNRVAFTVEPTYLFSSFSDENGGGSRDFLMLWGLAFSL